MAPATLLLYPGAGSDRDHSSLVATADRAAARPARRARPIDVRRLDFPYRRAGRRAPDRAPVLMASIRDDLADVSRRRGPVVMGGRSMGGRMTTMVAADVDDAGPVARLAGLVAICYPLHPPGKTDQLRVAHLPNITVPCLFISGTKDPFGTPDELVEFTATIPAEVHHVWVDGAGHDLRRADDLIAERVIAFVESLRPPPQPR